MAGVYYNAVTPIPEAAQAMTNEKSVSPAAIRDLVDAGQGHATIVDPETNRRFVVQEEVEVTISDEYIREKLDEARDDLRAGRVCTRSTEQILAEAKKRRDAQAGREASA